MNEYILSEFQTLDHSEAFSNSKDHHYCCKTCEKYVISTALLPSASARATMNLGEKRQSIMDYHNLSRYLIAIALGHTLLDRKILRMNEFVVFENMMREKYGLPQASIFRDRFVLFLS